MSEKQSAGLLMFRIRDKELEVFLVHPGGPYWAKKGGGSWTVPKGEFDDEEEALAAAVREFREETGFEAEGPFLPLGRVRQKSGKMVEAWGFRGDCDPARLVSNTCLIEWPPRSGKNIEIPEVDQGRWFTLEEARKYLREAQWPFLERLAEVIHSEDSR
ncbi:NUDIX domain-containing protein [Terriglobus albidus]|uniref:NUDIX domain-containing protein n=1 Tax=Terriglobus albidus TaxID=1592106 RepID=A0A5B9EDU6_9BACT|nr:NUDIX domain-containing protein [Terriglobus albidus]QEE28561.1 NUDIX domain-containing protein [Terriglobus albidus]